MRRALYLVLVLFLLSGGMGARGGISNYTDRGKIDFDTAMELLNPYGTWVKIDGLWAYTPLNHAKPYTNGRWIYTEYGWCWKGNEPHSWATEHYGYWKRGANKVWSWYPTPEWLPQIVEIRATSTHIGWRAAEVDVEGNFVEPAADRFAKTDEWTVVSLAQFTGPITPGMVESNEVAARVLDDSAESMHTYVTYRAIERPGPHPADFLVYKPEGMFAPEVENDPVPYPKPPVTVNPVPVMKTGAPAPVVKSAAVNPGLANPASSGVATNAAPVTNDAGSVDDDAAASAADARQVPYWITMSLPSYWSKRPADAQPKEVYLYRPEFYQDQDGIERRVQLWLNPASRTTLGGLREALEKRPPGGSEAAAGQTPGQPAEKVAPSGAEDSAFKSPFEESFGPSTAGVASPNSSSKGAPSGLGHGPAPSGTNGAPNP